MWTARGREGASQWGEPGGRELGGIRRQRGPEGGGAPRGRGRPTPYISLVRHCLYHLTWAAPLTLRSQTLSRSSLSMRRMQSSSACRCVGGI